MGKIFYEEEYISEIESYLYKTEIYQDNKTHNFSLESVDKEYIDDIYNELISKISSSTIFKSLILCINKFWPQNGLKFLFFTLVEPALQGITIVVLLILFCVFF